MIFKEDPKVLHTTWASDTTNKIEIDDKELAQGILYKGPILSNQLNGMGNDIYSRLEQRQYLGDLYNETLTYHKGNFVYFWWKEDYFSNPRLFVGYPLIDGLVNQPPIKDAIYNYISLDLGGSGKGFKVFSGGKVNKDLWNIQETAPLYDTYKEFENLNTSRDFEEYLISELPSVISASKDDPKFKIVFFEGYLSLSKFIQNTGSTNIAGSALIPIKIKATYTLGTDVTDKTSYFYALPTEMPYIEIEYGQITCNANKKFFAGYSSSSDNPYPICFPYSATIAIKMDRAELDRAKRGKLKINLITKGIMTSITMQGRGNLEIIGTLSNEYLTDSDKNEPDETKVLDNLVIKAIQHYTIRSFGGTRVLGDVGRVVMNGFNTWGGGKYVTPLLYGCIPLSGIETILKSYPNFTHYLVWNLMLSNVEGTSWSWDYNYIREFLLFMNQKKASIHMGNETEVDRVPRKESYKYEETDSTSWVLKGFWTSEWYLQLF